jgi:hypothetical protein
MRASHSTANDGRAVCALFAVFALLFQALIPTAAMAQVQPGGETVICTSHGTQIVAPRGPPAAPHRNGMPCQDCLSACMTAVVAPALAVMPVSYLVRSVEHAPAAIALAPRARAPPRPLGQGPPTA